MKLIYNKILSFDQEQACEPSNDSLADQYEDYRVPEFSNRCTPFRQNADEYDRYQYDHGESPVQGTNVGKPCARLKSCCNYIGRLVDSILSSF